MTAPRANTESKLLAEIRLAIGARRDLLVTRINTGVYAAPNAPKTRIRSAPNGFPDLIVTQLRRHRYTHEVNSTFSSYSELRWHYYGQSIAFETKALKGRLSEAQRNWCDAFEAVGGIYVVPKTLTAVLDVLGGEPGWVDERPVK